MANPLKTIEAYPLDDYYYRSIDKFRTEGYDYHITGDGRLIRYWSGNITPSLPIDCNDELQPGLDIWLNTTNCEIKFCVEKDDGVLRWESLRAGKIFLNNDPSRPCRIWMGSQTPVAPADDPLIPDGEIWLNTNRMILSYYTSKGWIGYSAVALDDSRKQDEGCHLDEPHADITPDPIYTTDFEIDLE